MRACSFLVINQQTSHASTWKSPPSNHVHFSQYNTAISHLQAHLEVCVVLVLAVAVGIDARQPCRVGRGQGSRRVTGCSQGRVQGVGEPGAVMVLKRRCPLPIALTSTPNLGSSATSSRATHLRPRRRPPAPHTR